MNAANLTKSARLLRIDKMLSDGREYTTREIVKGAEVMAVSAAVSELRANGRVIHCRREKDVWYYRRDLRAERKSA
jgi:hypothetical protein